MTSDIGPKFYYVTNKSNLNCKEIGSLLQALPFLHSTCLASSQPVEQVSNLIDLPRQNVSISIPQRVATERKAL